MRISDWSSDVCSSDLLGALGLRLPADLPVRQGRLTAERGMARALLNRIFRRRAAQPDSADDAAVEALTTALSLRRTDRARAELQADFEALRRQIGRASCRERVCEYVSISVGAVTLKKKDYTKPC